MDPLIRSLHHVTATVTDAREDLAFYTSVLGLRLVKRTVNFDDTGVYHLYYGDERGTPSTIMTTFPYGGRGVRVGTKGAGQITVTSFSVPPGSLDHWRDRLVSHGWAFEDVPSPFGEDALAVQDPSGLDLRLVEALADDREPWVGGGVGAEHAIRGVHGVGLTIRAPKRSLELLTQVLGLREVDRTSRHVRVAAGEGGPGSLLEIEHAPDAPEAVNGLGTVHHVAMAVPDEEEQLRIRAELIRLGLSVTPVRDRQYFRSIYFREPGGVLYELATVGPGFDTDERVHELGRELRLPTWEEPNRADIEAALPPLDTSLDRE